MKRCPFAFLPIANVQNGLGMPCTTRILSGSAILSSLLGGQEEIVPGKKRAMSDTIRKKLCLFDVDGTLTPAREEASQEMKSFLCELKKICTVGIVGGSDLSKQQEQVGKDVTDIYDYSFSENGLVAYKDGKLVGKQSISVHLGEDNIKRIVNFALHYIADLDIPIKRGTFIEFRNGMLNVSPIGRNCSKEERNDYEKFDLANNIRTNFVKAMKERFADLNLTYSIGGQISFDVFPEGWDKTYALNFIGESEYEEIHFFGDKTFVGGNDYEIFSHPRVKGHTVNGPEDTMTQCKALFFS
jgi:phosphomannomutase